MTEVEWLACTNPDEMREPVFGPGKDRTFRLLACACCRRIWDSLDQRSRECLEVAERFADGRVDRQGLAAARASQELYLSTPDRMELRIACHPVWDATWEVVEGCDAAWAAWDMARAADWNVATFLADEVEPPGGYPDVETYDAARTACRAENAALLRDVFGNPFRPASFDPAWRTPAVVESAAAAYEHRSPHGGHLDLARLAVLGDTLEEAGCTDASLLDHLRSPGPHVRGCFAVDLVLVPS